MKSNLAKSVFLVVTFFTLIIAAETSVRAQKSSSEPELCVTGFCLGENEETAKAALQAYSPRYDNEFQQPKYFFYNEFGNQVMSITAYSKERPFLIVGIEVFAVDDTYQKKHFQMKETAAFLTESGFFIGLRPSASSMIFGVPNSTGPKEVVKKKGQPAIDEKPEKVRTLRYKLAQVNKLKAQETPGNKVNFGSYTAEYRFYKNNLRHIILSVETSL